MKDDPLKYFRQEASELAEHLARGALELERRMDPALVARLLRHAHTLKGAARVVKQSVIAEHAHALESVLGPLRERTGTPSPEEMKEILHLTDAIGGLVAKLAPGKPREEVPVPTTREAGAVISNEPTNEPLRTVRADIGEMDALVTDVTEASVRVASIGRATALLERAHHLAQSISEHVDPAGPPRSRAFAVSIKSQADELRGLLADALHGVASGVEQAGRELAGVRESLENLRFVPTSSLFGLLERTARDAANALGKQVEVRAHGGAVRLDADVLEALQAALVQIVRNAVAHGIESPAERAGAGKPRFGVITIDIRRKGDRVVCACRDDGRGIDLAAVRRSAIHGGRLSSSDRPSDDELIQLLLAGGISTSGMVTEVAGRGIGLDVVRESARRLGGDIEVQTEVGRGVGIRMVVPVSLSSIDALLVEAAGVTAAIPLDAAVRILRVAEQDIAQTPDGASILDGDAAVPLAPLARLLGAATVPAALRPRPTVIVSDKGKRAALTVDHVEGRATVVVRKLSPFMLASPVVTGASLDIHGEPRLVLDPEALVSEALRSESRAPETVHRERPPVLVIDDSLTTRMLEQTILEAAGYEVDLAVSGEEGLEKARRRTYRLVLCDVEMPNMSGFDVAEAFQADPSLASVPIILVTSRSAPEDRKRGKDAGARAYVVKSEFDQNVLLETIERLTG